ncbi:BNR repeat-containing protein [Microlunatus speluncae]|uniref:BNR repeat-containing protein n=1 Tax=Microlunatus speluncae TaxID=2594267 RepID=UPI0012661F5B|nr:BNR repeat-containing protein [Microlunatus speluncae]
MATTRRRVLQLTGAAAVAVSLRTTDHAAADDGLPDDAAEVSWVEEFDRADGAPGDDWAALRGDWQLVDHGLRTPAGPAERVIARTGFELGARFRVEATLRCLQYDHWCGVAFNLIDHGDGTQSYYAVRIVTRADSRPPSWQLLQVTRSVVDGGSLIAQGPVPVQRNTDYRVSIGSRSYGVIDLMITDGAATLLDGPFVVPLARLLSAGSVGLYANSGEIGVDRIEAVTTTPAADPPDPGPLQFVPFDGVPYELPSADESVVEHSEVGPTWSGHSVGQALLTHGDQQYVAYYDAERRMTVAQRTLGETTWIRQGLDSVVGWDSHNYVTLAIDRAGQLHVSGNMHVVPLVYFRSTRPGDVASLVRMPIMVDAGTEQRVTYPRFFTNPDGDLIFRYRDGSSGDGVDLYNLYDSAAGTWRRLLDQPLHDGEGLRNAYVEGPTLGPDGFYHVAWVWRDSGDAATNQHLSYARSRDLRAWERSDGTPLTLPITFATGEVIDPVPMNGGIINGNTKIGFDADGRIMITYHKYDADGNTQVYVARREHRDWVIRKVSRWTGRWAIGGGGTLRFEVTVTGAVPLPDRNLRVDFTCQGHARTWVLSPGLRPIAELDTPQLPPEITTVRSTFPGMLVHAPADAGTAPEGRYLLRWESRPSNKDRPWDPPHPDPGPLEVYRLD